MNNLDCLVSPRLQVPLTVWQKMMAYIIECPTEINGFGLVEEVDTNLFLLSDIFITEQVASPSHVEVDPGVIGTLMTDMIRAGQDPSQLKFQWHSHVHMAAYFSPTDTGNIETWPGDWLISLVANKYGQYSCRLDTFKGLRIGVELQPELVTAIDRALLSATAREIAAKVRNPGWLRRRVSNGTPLTDGLVPIGDPDLVQAMNEVRL